MGGTAIVFVPLLALAMASLYIVLVFASHYFLTLVECAAQGQRQVQWPAEACTEWLGKPLHLLWIAGLYMLPAVLIARSVGHAAGSSYVTFAFIALAFAMLFPLGALSAFIANNVWTPFHPKAIPLLLMKPIMSISFFAIGFVACAVGLGGGFLAIYSNELGGTLGCVVGAVLVALAWFVYACALGRLLFALTYTAPPPRKRRKKAEGGRRKADPQLNEPARQKREKSSPPSAFRPPPSEDEVPHWEKPPPAWDPDRDERPYMAHEAEVVTKTALPEIAKPTETEMKLIEKEPPPPPPGNPFGADAFLPMGQSETMRNVLLLAIMVAIQSGLVRMLIDMNPTK